MARRFPSGFAFSPDRLVAAGRLLQMAAVWLAMVCVVDLPPAIGQDLTAIEEPEKLGFDSAKLQAIDGYFEQQIEDGKIVGCAGLAFKDGKIIYSNTWGQRDRRKDLPVEPDTIWRIYSMSKPITSAAVMQLVEKGKVDLDDPVSTYLPEFEDLKVCQVVTDKNDPKVETVECDREMTVRDLLRHTSGLTYGFFGNTTVDQAYRQAGILVLDADLEDTVEKLSKIPLLYQPGKRWHYSASTDVLGRVVEVASETDFNSYLQENIFEPLKMVDTFFSVPKNEQDRFAEMYRFEDGKLEPAPRLSSLRFISDRNNLYSGGGGLCSTTQDYLRFSRALLNEGELDGKRILKAETVREMTRNQLPKGAADPGFQFGLGFRIDRQGQYFWGGAAGTRFWIDPKNKMVTIFMIQIYPYRGNHGEEFKKLVYAAMNDAPKKK